MPGLKVAVANGNWSNPATWLNGTLPKAGDTVASNGFTITIDQNVSVDSIINSAQAIIRHNPVMTSPTTPSGVVTSLPADSGLGDAAWRAFDGSGSPSPAWYASTSVFPIWIAYEYASPVAITQYSLTLRNDNYDPKDWTFEAWDGSTWIVLNTVVNRTSGGSFTSPNFNNTTAYSRYRVNVSANRGFSGLTIILEINLFEYGYTQQSIAGGGFILGENVTLNCTGSIPQCPTTVLTWNGAAGTTSTINTPFIFGASVAGINNVLINGTGTLNINVTRITGALINVTSRTLFINSNCTVNIVGDIAFGPSTSATVVLVNSICTLNITGTITHNVGSGLVMLNINAAAIVNITGSVICNVNSASNRIISIGVGAVVTITGSITNTSLALDSYAIDTNAACSLRIIGSITGGFLSPSIRSTSSSAINIFSGPFICSTYGFMPYLVTRMHLIPSPTSYIEFRDETTNGAVTPGPTAPAAKLLQPGYAVDAPAVNNVRAGITYASGTLTGTCQIPVREAVAFGVAVDNTTGLALLSPSEVWDVPASSVGPIETIGERVKNAASEQAVAAIINAFN